MASNLTKELERLRQQVANIGAADSSPFYLTAPDEASIPAELEKLDPRDRNRVIFIVRTSDLQSEPIATEAIETQAINYLAY
jgi:hypothetical protein